jgi:beta-lactamase superfamily II metal-dependent hydrolase
VRLSTPPRADEVEISIFGPSLGECIVMHLGDNEWCIVDSCIARDRKEPVAIDYLKGFGTKALDGLKLVIATHWHDDHIQGLAAILRQAPQAQFCCSMALRRDEFTTLVATAPENIQGRSGVEELAAILKDLRTNQRKSGPSYAIENRSLLRLAGAGRSFVVRLTALSPSDAMITSTLKVISTLLPKVDQSQARIIDTQPNHASVVLWLEAGATRALLGADLQHTKRAGEGWMAVVANHQDTTPALIFKVPHHGSENADFPDVWAKMLTKDPIAAVTPFARGNVRLPGESDLERLSGQTSELYCTSPGVGKPPTRDTSIERWIKGRKRRVIEGQPGHVRIRWSTAEESVRPNVELFRGAYRVRTDP